MICFSKKTFGARKKTGKIPYFLAIISFLLGMLFITHNDMRHTVWIQHMHQTFHALGGFGVKLYQPAIGWFGKIYDRFWDAPAKIVLLQDQIQSLEHFESQAHILEQQNRELRHLLDLSPWEGYTYVTARILNYDQENLASYCLIDKGETEGLGKGFAVFSQEGLLGRIDTIGPHHARVILVHAQDFRVPVTGEKSSVRAILAGHDKPFLKIIHRDRSKDFEDDERLVTIQDHPWLPEGIPVGYFHQADTTEEGIEGKITSVLETFQAHFVRVLIPASSDLITPLTLLPRQETKKRP